MSATLVLCISSLVAFSVCFVPISGLNHEGFSLLSWISTFNSSESYSFFSSWDHTHPNPCNWAFITCSSKGSISEIRIKSIDLPTTFPYQFLYFNSLTKLVLSDTNITGEIPALIANCSTLVTLDLSYNALTGKIPPDIGKLSQLQFLYLNSNSLQGVIPPQISNCSNLRQLELVDNQLSGKIPAELGILIHLEIFRAGGNLGIHGEIPLEIGHCQELAFLGLADTSISGQIPPSFGGLKNLKTLSLYTANLSGVIPSEITNCSSLENLFLYQNRLSGELPAEMGLMKNLKRVLLWKNGLTGSIPESLGNCTSLTVMDFSLNSISGNIPLTLANLVLLEEFLLSDNNISSKIPPFIGNFSHLKQLELDNNRFFGEIPREIGKLKELTEFFAWQNQLQGNIPFELDGCEKLQALDLSYNFLTGHLPISLFNVRSLNKLMLISNGFSGVIPPDISNCTGLVRLRLGYNRLSGEIPRGIGFLRSLNFLELSENQLSGVIPSEIGNCTRLEMIDLHENRLQGSIPASFKYLSGLTVLDLSRNRISGSLPEILGELRKLNKFSVNENYITGLIPKSLGQCKNLQSLDLSSNRLSGLIPDEIGNLQGLDIFLNMSWNYLSGPVPTSFSNLSKLCNLDLSHNTLTGSLLVLGELQNLVSLDVSYNNFSGYLPDTAFFHDLPVTAFSGNQDLCTNGSECFLGIHAASHHQPKGIIFSLVLSVTLTVLIVMLGALLLARVRRMGLRGADDEQMEQEWEFTPFQKLSFSVEDIATELLDSNIIGKGSSGVVYRVETDSGQTIAVKKLWPDKKNVQQPERDSFVAEVGILGSIRHKNILRLLGCCSSRSSNTRLLLFDYICNGSLGELLHDKRMPLDWNTRYKIVLGAANGLAYLHHDCFPPIVHRDIKANNILVGPQFEAYLSDFGIAKVIDHSNLRTNGAIAGSYGYIAPEYGFSLRITEKSDVYSYGVVLLEVLTRIQPNDSQIPGGTHIVDWVRRELQRPDAEAISLLDRELQALPDSEIQEMLQVFGVAFLCVNPYPEERPSMKDIAAVLKGIKFESRDQDDRLAKSSKIGREVAECSSFSRRSSEPLIAPSP